MDHLKPTNFLKETTFIAKNQDDWRQLETLLKNKTKDADKLLHLFEKVSGDLAYARTYYPNRSIRVYLNNLTQQVLNLLVKKRKRFQLSSIVDFYRVELPTEIYRSRKAFIASFVIFAIAVLIGVVSSANVDNFANIVLGNGYVEMTQNNINDGDPMAVYKDMEQGDMFMKITINNIRVSFFCFILGLLGSFGTIFVLLSNGIMLGTFQYYFYQKGLFMTSFLTIWIHGTIEISSIIIAGAAGLILGNGLLFPKSYSRNTALLLSAKRALKIILAIMPLFMIAGFLESFVTRLTEMPTIGKVLIIGISALLILTIFVIYPIYCVRNGLIDLDSTDLDPVEVDNIDAPKYQHRTLGATIAIAFGYYRQVIGPFLVKILLPVFLLLSVAGFLILKYRVLAEVGIPEELTFFSFDNDLWLFGLVLYFSTTLVLIWLMKWSQGEMNSFRDLLSGVKQYFLVVTPFSIVFTLGYYYMHMQDYYRLVFLLIPIHFIFIMLEELSKGSQLSMSLVVDKFKFSFAHWFNFIVISLILVLYIFLMTLLATSSVGQFVIEFVSWHDIFGNAYADEVLVSNILLCLIYLIPIPLAYFAYTYRYGSLMSLSNSVDLLEKLKQFGSKEHRYYLGK